MHLTSHFYDPSIVFKHLNSFLWIKISRPIAFHSGKVIFPFTDKRKQQYDPSVFFIALVDTQTLLTEAIIEIHIS